MKRRPDAGTLYWTFREELAKSRRPAIQKMIQYQANNRRDRAGHGKLSFDYLYKKVKAIKREQRQNLVREMKEQWVKKVIDNKGGRFAYAAP
jgi:hypothetical protein